MLDLLIKHEKKIHTAEACIICAVVPLTCSFWQFEHVPSAVLMKVLLMIAAAVMVAVWLYTSFTRGLLNKPGFAVFTALYWTIPPIIAAMSDKVADDPRKFDIRLYLAGEYSKLLGPDALLTVPVLKNMDSLISGVVFSSICLAVFLIGQFIGSKHGRLAPEAVPADEEGQTPPPAPATAITEENV